MDGRAGGHDLLFLYVCAARLAGIDCAHGWCAGVGGCASESHPQSHGADFWALPGADVAAAQGVPHFFSYYRVVRLFGCG